MANSNDSVIGAPLVIDEPSGKVFLVIDAWSRLVESAERYGSLVITDPGQGEIVVTAAQTNHDPRDGGYLVAWQRELRLRSW